MIAFFGTTGSGKSTSVNYFMGHDLKLVKNDFGDTVVRLRYQDDEAAQAKIGYSIGTSETVYSEGLQFLDNVWDPDSELG